MRTLVVGDIHSGVRALEQLMIKAKVTSKDHIIFLGDYVDAWSTAVETVDYLIRLQREYRCTFIRGNHDELCRAWLMDQKENPQWLELKNYHLTDDNRLYLHAGYTNLKGIDYEYFEQTFYWDRTLWELATAMDRNLEPSDPKFPKRLTHYKEVYIGHTPLSKTAFVEPQKRANVWNVDTGAAFKGGLTMMDVESKEYWQSDPVFTFYPGERGRN